VVDFTWLKDHHGKEIPPDIPADKHQDKHFGMDHLTTWFDILLAVDHFPNLFYTCVALRF